MVGLFRRFPPSPPFACLGPFFRRPPLFFSLAFSGFARSGLGVLVLVFSPSLFFCLPLLVFWLSIPHLIFILISLSFLVILIFISLAGYTLLGRVCVCGTSEQT